MLPPCLLRSKLRLSGLRDSPPITKSNILQSGARRRAAFSQTLPFYFQSLQTINIKIVIPRPSLRKQFRSEVRHKLITGDRCGKLQIKPIAFLSAFQGDIQEQVHGWEVVLECCSCSLCSPDPQSPLCCSRVLHERWDQDCSSDSMIWVPILCIPFVLGLSSILTGDCHC